MTATVDGGVAIGPGDPANGARDSGFNQTVSSVTVA